MSTVSVTIDNRPVTVPAGTTIWDAAKAAGIDIPVLCHHEKMRPVGVCRMCVVDTGGRVLTASCVRPCETGMKVQTATPKVEASRAMLTELRMADQPAIDAKETTTGGNELIALARRYQVDGKRFAAPASGRPKDESSAVI